MTIVAVMRVVPFIALQLKADLVELDHLQDFGARPRTGHAGLTSIIAATLALFTILFGTRRLDATERHEGMVAAIAFESVVKLVAFLAVGVFVTYGMFGGLSDLFRQAAASPELGRLLQLDGSRAGTWTALILLSGLAIICLPRQFQIIVVENVDEDHLRRAVWLFPLYLVVINIFVLPLALGGLLHFQGTGVNPDTFVLTLPLARGAETLALLVFIGGLSAATGMVIVETIALSNDGLQRPGHALAAAGERGCGPKKAPTFRGCRSASAAPPSSSSCCWATSTSGPRARPMRWSASG